MVFKTYKTRWELSFSARLTKSKFSSQLYLGFPSWILNVFKWKKHVSKSARNSLLKGICFYLNIWVTAIAIRNFIWRWRLCILIVFWLLTHEKTLFWICITHVAEQVYRPWICFYWLHKKISVGVKIEYSVTNIC